MFRKKTIIVKKDLVAPEKIDPLLRRKNFGETKFDRFDIPGETAKAVRKILMLILALFILWFFYECILSWDIFQ